MSPAGIERVPGPPPTVTGAAGPVLRFHLRVGVRLALQAMIPLAAGFVVAVGMSPDPSETVALLAAGAMGADPDPMVLAAFAAAALGMAIWTAPRLTAGLHGWIRHLPVDSTAHRRAAWAAVTAAQAPALVLLGLLAAGAALGGEPPAASRTASLVILGPGAALAALPVARRWLAAPAGLAALWLALAGTWPSLLVAAVLLAAADRVVGPLRLPARGGRVIPAPRRPPALAARGVPAGGEVARSVPEGSRIALRALRWRILSAYPGALLILGGAALFVSNNALGGAAAGVAARLGGSLAVTVLLAGLAQEIRVRRPAWPWARSLPWTSKERVLADARLIGLAAAPVVILTAWLRPAAGPAVLAATPLLALRAAGAIRSSAGARSGAAGRPILEGLGVSLLIALIPWTALAALAAAPPALRAAARRERDQKVTRWTERHHLAAGDTSS